jgi:rhomboid family GlyGly-CTERM serine protease
MTTSRPVGRFKGLITSLIGDGHSGVALAATLLLLVLVQLGGPATLAALRYDRGALGAGQLWRLVSAHIVHLDLRHTILNAAGLLLLWALFIRDYRPRQWFLILLAATAAIDAGLWFRDTQVIWYVGASGVLHGVLAAGVLAQLRRREPSGLVLAVLLIAKLGYEQVAGPLPFAGSAVPVVVDAHLYGVLGGLAAALWMRPLAVRL